MDGLSHYIIPYVAGRRLKWSRAQLMASTYGGLFPDSDAFTVVLGWDALRTWHATLTHSLPGLLLIAIGGGLFFWRFFGRGQKWYEVVLPGLLGAATHTVLDMFNASREGWHQLLPFIPYQPPPPRPDLPPLAAPLGNYVPYWEDVLSLQPLHAVYLYMTVSAISVALLIWCLRRKDYPWEIWIGRRGEKIWSTLRWLIGRPRKPTTSPADPSESPAGPSPRMKGP